MNGPRDYHTKWSQSDKQKADIIWYHLYVESKKWSNQTSLETDLQTQKTNSRLPKETGWGEVGGQEG